MGKALIILAAIFISACSKEDNYNHPGPILEFQAGAGVVSGSGDFGELEPKSSKFLTVKIYNEGDEPLLGPPSIDNNNFTIAYQLGCNSINPGKVCTLKLKFSALGKIPQTYAATLSLADVFINLSAKVLPHEDYSLSFSSSPLDFGIIKDNQVLTKSLLITNSGSSSIDNQQVSLATGDGVLYKILYDQCSNKIILPNKSCLVKLLLNGQGRLGAVNETLNFAGKSLLVVGVVANSQGASILDNPDVKFLINNDVSTSYDFGYISGSQSKQLVINAKNLGNNISDTSIAQVLGSSFQIILNRCNKALAPAESCQIRLVFSASGKNDGLYQDTLVFAGQSLSLSGNVGIPVVVPPPDITSNNIESTQVTAANTWTDVVGANIQVVPTGLNEKWEITYQGTVEATGFDSNPIYGGIRIVDSENNEVDSSVVLMGTVAPGYFYPSARIIKLTARDTISSAKTYKLQLRKGSSGYTMQIWNNDYTGALTNPDLSHKLYAIKVPSNSSYVDSGEISSTMISSSNVWHDVVGATLTVNPSSSNEKVEINFKGSFSLNLIPNAVAFGNLRIVDGSNNLIDNALVSMMETQAVGFSSAVPVHLMARDTISSPKTYKVQIRHINANWAGVFTDSYTTETSNPDLKAVFYAQKFPTSPTYINSPLISSTLVSSVDTWVDVQGAVISINPSSLNEKWELRFQGMLDVILSDNNTAVGNIRIVDEDNNLVDNSIMAIVARSGTIGANIGQHINIVARANVSTPKTFKVQIRKGSAGTSVRILGDNPANFNSGLSDPDYTQRFFAVKY